jgi:predicted glycosyl hydrolase (DUF1957 family)
MPQSSAPRQDSNLRSRLRRALLCTALTWPYVLNGCRWGAYGARMGREERERGREWERATLTREVAVAIGACRAAHKLFHI